MGLANDAKAIWDRGRGKSSNTVEGPGADTVKVGAMGSDTSSSGSGNKKQSKGQLATGDRRKKQNKNKLKVTARV